MNYSHRVIAWILFFVIVFFLSPVRVEAQEIILDNSENAFKGYIFYPEYMQDCGTVNYMDTGGPLNNIQAEIILDFDSGSIAGTISGRQLDEQYAFVYKEDNRAQGTISGVIEKKNTGNSARDWYWEFTGTVDFIIHFHMEHKCSDDTGGYWETEEQTLAKIGFVSGRTYGDLWSIDIRYEDQDTLDGRTRYVSFSVDQTTSSLIFPPPIDLDISISIPDEVDLTSDTTPFELSIEGKDSIMIDHIDWYFAYWEPDLELYWGLPEQQQFATTGTETLIITQAMRDEWKSLAYEYGYSVDEGAEIDLQINIRALDETGKDLIDNYPFNFTYYTTLVESTGGEEDTNENEASTSNTETNNLIDIFSNSITGLTTPLVQGAVSAGAGFGFASFLKRYLKKPEKPTNTPEKPETGSRQGEEILKLKNEDQGTKAARKRERLKKLASIYGVESEESLLAGGIPYIEKNWSENKEIDEKYEKWRKERGLSPKEEYLEIMRKRPKFLESVVKQYVYEKTYGKTDYSIGSYLDTHLNKEETEMVNQWMQHLTSRNRRDYELNRPHGAAFSAVTGPRG